MPGISNSFSPQLCLVALAALPLTSPQDVVYIGDGNEAGRDFIGISTQSSNYYQGKLDLLCLLFVMYVLKVIEMRPKSRCIFRWFESPLDSICHGCRTRTKFGWTCNFRSSGDLHWPGVPQRLVQFPKYDFCRAIALLSHESSDFNLWNCAQTQSF